jgi:hypothetical protein
MKLPAKATVWQTRKNMALIECQTSAQGAK